MKKGLDSLHPAVRSKFDAFVAECEAAGWEIVVTSAYRSFSDQAALKKADSRNAAAGSSMHNFGMAIDINALKVGTALRKATKKEDWDKSGIPAIARKHGLRWGGSSFAGYYDPVHFDAGNYYGIGQLQAAAKRQFGTNPAAVRGNEVAV